MEAGTSLLFRILEWAWLGLIGVGLHLYKRIEANEDNLQKCAAQTEKDIAVIENSVKDLREAFKRQDARNEDTHKAIIEKIDRHHETVVATLMDILQRIKNGNGKA